MFPIQQIAITNQNYWFLGHYEPEKCLYHPYGWQTFQALSFWQGFFYFAIQGYCTNRPPANRTMRVHCLYNNPKPSNSFRLDCQPFYWFQFLCPYLPLQIVFSMQGESQVIGIGSSILEAFMQRKDYSGIFPRLFKITGGSCRSISVTTTMVALRGTEGIS